MNSQTYFLIVSEHRVYGISGTIGTVEAQRKTFQIPFDVQPVVANSYRGALEVAMYDLGLKLCERMGRVYAELPRGRGRVRTS